MQDCAHGVLRFPIPAMSAKSTLFPAQLPWLSHHFLCLAPAVGILLSFAKWQLFLLFFPLHNPQPYLSPSANQGHPSRPPALPLEKCSPLLPMGPVAADGVLAIRLPFGVGPSPSWSLIIKKGALLSLPPLTPFPCIATFPRPFLLEYILNTLTPTSVPDSKNSLHLLSVNLMRLSPQVRC